MPRVAVLQMTSGIDPEANLRVIEDAARDAAADGAAMLFAPEMAVLLDRNRDRAEPHIQNAAVRCWGERLTSLAVEHGVDLVVGSPYPGEGGRNRNRLWYASADGDPARFYDKMHMFDVDLASGESWRESNAYHAGNKVVVIDKTPVGRLGLTICYDIRFPALFDALGRQGCDVIAIPAAFTVPTGKAHWHTLVTARAIEASAFVIAAAQVGRHEDGRETYGHSLVVDPWGDVLLDMKGEEAGLGFADIDLDRIAEARAQVPSLANRRSIPN